MIGSCWLSIGSRRLGAEVLKNLLCGFPLVAMGVQTDQLNGFLRYRVATILLIGLRRGLSHNFTRRRVPLWIVVTINRFRIGVYTRVFVEIGKKILLWIVAVYTLDTLIMEVIPAA